MLLGASGLPVLDLVLSMDYALEALVFLLIRTIGNIDQFSTGINQKSGLDNNVCTRQMETFVGQVKFIGHLSVGTSKTNKPIQKYPTGSL